MDNHQKPTCFAQNLLSYLICGLLAGQPVFPAFAAPTPANAATGIDKAGNGVPVVNIATPNGAGISHNQFQNYNVGKEGLILNNATGQLNQTQLGGLIQNNTNLKAGHEARGIINEVTGANRSQLNGYTEVAGKAANVMVANPYGITCNGCGFINTPNVTLTTGKPVFDASGNVQSLEVKKGAITLEGQGLNASQTDALSIISRATEVNAEIHANALNVIAGANRVDKKGRVTAIKGEGAAPVVAVDTGALGGMYANRIHLVSSDKGVGVNLGNLDARQGDITLEANGKLTVKNSLARGSLNAKGESVTLSGEHKASGNMTVSGHDMTLSNGTFASDNNIVLNSEGKLAINNTRLTTGNNLSLTAQDFTQDSRSSVNTARDISARVTGTATNQGQLIAGHSAAISSGSLSNSGKIAAKSTTSITATKTLSNAAGGEILSDEALVVSAEDTRQSGTLSGKKSLAISGRSLTATKGSLSTSLGDVSLKTHEANLGGDVIAHGDLAVQAESLTSQRDARLQSDGSMTLTATDATLYGTQAAQDALTLTAQSLVHGGVTTAANLTVSSGQFNNLSEGLFLSQGSLDVSANALLNTGQIMGDNLSLTSKTLSNEGLWQGTSALTLTAEELRTGNTSRTLTAGDLTLNAGLLNTAGTLQGQHVVISARDWMHSGSLLGTGDVDVSLARTLDNSGDILSEGNTTLTAQSITNRGSLLSNTDLTLTGDMLDNRGALQGNNLLMNLISVANSGTAVGLQLLQLAGHELLNDGQLLSGGALAIRSENITNNGIWQGQNIVLDAHQLVNRGTLQSADALTLKLTGDLTSAAGSKIIANGNAALQALNLTNDGQWLASNLVIHGASLNNNGDISGVNGLVVALTGAFTQQQDKTLLTGGTLELSAETVNNAGQIQGADIALTSHAVGNSGRIQANADLTLSGNLTNRATGSVLSQNTLNLAMAKLENDGLIQGGGTTKIDASASARNDGRILSGGELTLHTAKLTNNNWLQATSLLLNANSLDNTGTLFGTSNLTIHADQIEHRTTGKLYSGGNLLLTSGVFDQLGQVVALGNLTLKLTAAFTAKNVLAAGNVLDITSNGAITNQSVMQGQAVNLTAGAALTNDGQITTGSGASTLSADSMAMNASGTLQAGGDVTLNSRGNITVDGFVGTAGSLTLNAASSILNTALLYAGNNMYLLANSIRNNHGDILAGDSLWMQRDMAGHANAEVVNTSGNIETVNGDITVKTGHLLNEREKLEVTSSGEEDLTQQYDWLTTTEAYIPLDMLTESDYGYIYGESCSGGGSPGHGASPTCHDYAVAAPYINTPDREFAVSRYSVTVDSKGAAGRISSGRNMLLAADSLENIASIVLANGNINLSGTTLRNESYISGSRTRYQTYEIFTPTSYAETDFLDPSVDFRGGSLHFVANGENRTENNDSTLYRSVIQAGGNVIANFTRNISNTTTTANAGSTSNTLTVPTLDTLSQPDGAQQQDLANTDSADITSPQWYDSLTDAVANITGGGSLYPLPSGNNGYFVPATDANSPYLITTNPKLDGLGQLDQSLFGELYSLTGMQPGSAPRETNSAYTDQNQFLGSAYFLDRLNLHPEYDYRFLGDAAFDTRYVSNVMLNQTGNRYINGLGSDLEQMQYLMDNAAGAQQSLGLAFGVALTAEQIAALDSSILWWESATINGQTVMVPKVYLSPKDVTVNNGSVISGNNVQLTGGNITNSGSSINASNNLILDSQNSISNLNAGLMQAGGGLQLSALGDINNIGSTISGKTVQLESVGGSINNITQTEQWQAGGTGRRGESVSFSETQSGPMAGIIAQDDMILKAGQDINITGSNVAAGDDLLMLADGNIHVTANTMTDSESQSGFRRKDATHSESVTSEGSSITAGGSLGMQAGNDVTIEASQINAGENAVLIAGNDLNLNAAGTRENSRQGKSETHSTDVATTTITSGNDLTLVAGQDINSHAAGLAAEGDVAMQAGRDVNLMAEEITDGNSYKAKKKVEINESVRQQSTEIISSGNTTIVAGRDVNSAAAQVIASGDISIGAGRDINLDTATESDYHFKEETKTKKGFMKKTTTHTVEEDSATREAGTLLSGDNVTLVAGNDLRVKGSAVVGDGNVSLNAGNNIDIVAATNTDSTYRLEEKKKSGMFSGGGIGVTIGTSKSRYEMNDEGTTQSESFSTVGSTGGNVSINAGGQAHIGGADIIAGKDLSIRGDSVLIEPGRDARTHDESFEQEQSGLTIALSGAAGSAVNSAVTTAQSVSDESDDRLAALKIAQAVMNGASTGQAMELAQATTGDASTAFGISASLGTQSSKSETHSGQNTATGSTLTAGDNLSIIATGGDITVIGSQIKAGLDVALNAADDINLISSQNTQWLDGENSSSGGAIGMGIGMGKDGAGINISASGNASRGSESGNGTQHNETTIDAGNRISINSGDDTTIAGAQVSGNSVVADIGGNLTISSLQDSDYYDSSQKSISGGASFSFGTMTGSGSISASHDGMDSDYNSVVEQSGIYAGDGGFDITVGGHTQLDGAVIASTGSADKNSLDTGTLGFSDIGNKAEYSTEHQGAGISTGGSIAENFIGNMANGVLVGAGGEGEASGTTKAAISEGNITIRDTENQQQDVADLSRDVEHANGSISPIFDKEKEQKRLEIAQALGDVGSQAADIARTAGEIKGLEAAKAAHPELSGKALLETKEYKDTQKQYGTGSDIQQGISAATMALQGLAGGDMAAALAGGAAPYLAEQIKKQVGEDNVAANAIAHAIVGGVIAELQGRDAAAGAAGAATGELIAQVLYPGVKREDLDETQKQKIVALSTLAAGLAGGIAGDDTAGIIAGAQGGKNATEYNHFNLPSGMMDYIDTAGSWNQFAVDNNLSPEQIQAGLDKIAKGDLPEGANITKAIVEGYQDGVFMAGAFYLGPTIAIGKGITGAVIGGGANSAFQYMNMAPGSEFSYYSAAVAAGAGYLAPGYKIGGNTLINMGGAFMTDGPSLSGQGGAIAGSVFGGGFGKYAPDLIAPYAGNASGFIGDIGGAFTFEYFNKKMKDSMEKE
ncbi:hemagglutinin repeat-containing protein [Rahnella victoriana]|uniref:hemagglutinin repeat-containing protein n=1 Tax=Rahnella victoriana TaxID=1510570 RepID=UPI00103DA4DF|nr:hemagglutinin repeat-containing protein [Rahnella victoriana]TBX32462.1 filamentous hemagglutinin N-terminal domain-containing protein [Rahnella victoriana]